MNNVRNFCGSFSFDWLIPWRCRVATSVGSLRHPHLVAYLDHCEWAFSRFGVEAAGWLSTHEFWQSWLARYKKLGNKALLKPLPVIVAKIKPDFCFYAARVTGHPDLAQLCAGPPSQGFHGPGSYVPSSRCC